MSGAEDVLDLSECLARFITIPRNIRSDGTVRPDALYPYSWVELSVTRHHGLTEAMVWQRGEVVAAEMQKPLVGRADLETYVFQSQGLRVISTPQPENTNHADAIDWPIVKHDQKEIAIEIAVFAAYVKKFD